MTILEFDAVQVAAVIALVGATVQGIKKLMEWVEKWTNAPAFVIKFATFWAHSKGPAILALLVSLFVVLLPGVAEDGKLTLPELQQILEVFGITIGSSLLYWITRWKWPFKKKTPQ